MVILPRYQATLFEPKVEFSPCLLLCLTYKTFQSCYTPRTRNLIMIQLDKSVMWPSKTKGTSCWPGLFWDNETKQCVKYKEDKWKFTLCMNCSFKSITSNFMNVVSWESLLNPLLDNAKISIFSEVDKMYLLLYWVTYIAHPAIICRLLLHLTLWSDLFHLLHIGRICVCLYNI